MKEHIAKINEESESFRWPAPISILAASPSIMPVKGSMQLLHNDVVWLGFLNYMADVIKLKLTKKIIACRHALRRVQVRFILCDQGIDRTEQKKWELESTTASVASNQTLRGWKRICGFGEVRQSLKDRSLNHSADAISAWLRKACVEISAKNLSSLLRVFALDPVVIFAYFCFELLRQRIRNE